MAVRAVCVRHNRWGYATPLGKSATERGALLQAVLDQVKKADIGSRGPWKVDVAGHTLGRLSQLLC